MKKAYCRILIIASLAILSSCGTYFYAPNMQNVPLISQEKEFTCSLSISAGTNFAGMNGAFAYSPINHLGVVASGSLLGVYDLSFDSLLYPPNDDVARGYIFEIGTGYFTPVRDKFIFELYGGGGIGNAKNWHEGEVCSSARFSRFYLQPALGYKGERFDVALSARLCGREFQEAACDGTEPETMERIDYIRQHPFSWLVEPGITVRYGRSFIKGQVQFIWSQNMSHPDQYQDKININLGVVLDIPPKGVRITPVKTNKRGEPD